MFVMFVMFVAVLSFKHISIYFPTQPIESAELTDAILKTELTDPTLNADVEEPILPTDATENAERKDPSDMNDIMHNIAR